MGDGPIDAASRDFSSPSVETPFSGEDEGKTEGKTRGRRRGRRGEDGGEDKGKTEAGGSRINRINRVGVVGREYNGWHIQYTRDGERWRMHG